MANKVTSLQWNDRALNSPELPYTQVSAFSSRGRSGSSIVAALNENSRVGKFRPMLSPHLLSHDGGFNASTILENLKSSSESIKAICSDLQVKIRSMEATMSDIRFPAALVDHLDSALLSPAPHRMFLHSPASTGLRAYGSFRRADPFGHAFKSPIAANAASSYTSLLGHSSTKQVLKLTPLTHSQAGISLSTSLSPQQQQQNFSTALSVSQSWCNSGSYSPIVARTSAANRLSLKLEVLRGSEAARESLRGRLKQNSKNKGYNRDFIRRNVTLAHVCRRPVYVPEHDDFAEASYSKPSGIPSYLIPFTSD